MDQFKSCKLFLSTHQNYIFQNVNLSNWGLNGRSIIGLWHGNEYNAILYKLELNFTPRSSSVEDDSPNFIHSVKKVGPFFSRSIIRDMCDTIFNGQEHVLYVGVESNFNSVKQNIAVLCRLTNHTSTNGKKYTYLKRLLCCCGCRNDNIFAAGTVSGIFVFANEEFTQIRDYGQKVRCTEFNSIGNILYCGIDNRGLVMYDRREDPWKCNDVKINNMNLENITSTKLLSGENAIIVSCLDGTLTQIDLRKKMSL
ncbi:WD_REPEATS_REGION domain-containing protein [Caerostris extrusa]|uniref:WD_REPEATS_REGION domain-containing protein n=1 Tax=Caerostris extrusa TaxID=172846 RepID=A0AAV4X9K1_CAEEX|nr:WD_REPEATS_REGION domain-containing protein [Caerostris extrusa]